MAVVAIVPERRCVAGVRRTRDPDPAPDRGRALPHGPHLGRPRRALGWRACNGPDFSAAGLNARSIVVVATQGHGDEEAIEQAVSAFRRSSAPPPPAGARRCSARWPAAGCPGTSGVPVGLDLGHTSHREIAVAILAELVQHRAAGELVPDPAAVDAPPARSPRPSTRSAAYRGPTRPAIRSSTTASRTTSAAPDAMTGSSTTRTLLHAPRAPARSHAHQQLRTKFTGGRGCGRRVDQQILATTSTARSASAWARSGCSSPALPTSRSATTPPAG